jgi:D-lactate dehydrogenase
VVTDDTLARLMTFPQVLVTSHQAYFTETAVSQIVDATLSNVEDFLAGRTSENTLIPGGAS